MEDYYLSISRLNVSCIESSRKDECWYMISFLSIIQQSYQNLDYLLYVEQRKGSIICLNPEYNTCRVLSLQEKMNVALKHDFCLLINVHCFENVIETSGWDTNSQLHYDTSKGNQIRPQSDSDWPQMGQIRDFFKSAFSTFWRPAPKCTEIWSEKSRICPIWGQSEPLWGRIWVPFDVS